MILMAINGFCNLYKGDVVLNKRSWHRCGKAEVESKSLGTGKAATQRLALCPVFVRGTSLQTLPQPLYVSFHVVLQTIIAPLFSRPSQLNSDAEMRCSNLS